MDGQLEMFASNELAGNIEFGINFDLLLARELLECFMNVCFAKEDGCF